MRRTSRSLSIELWRELVEKLDEGVIVFSDRGVVIYANDEAARLLGYSARDVLDLEKEDFVSLCQLDRLEGDQFASAFMGDSLPKSPERRYEIATADKRLGIHPFILALENGAVTVLLMQEILDWRAALISQTLMSPEMQSSLDAASSYCQTLLSRLEGGEADSVDTADFARIIANSVSRAARVWASLSQLYNTDQQVEPNWQMQPVSLRQALEDALGEIRSQGSQAMTNLHLDFPADLPPVAAAAPQLHVGLCALLEGASIKWGRQEPVELTAALRRRYIQVDLKPNGSTAGSLHGYLIDRMPLAIAEQVIARHGGRLWLNPHPTRPSTLSFSLPIWSADPQGQSAS